ncbi:MAG: hypothetical protein V1790_17340 [Planctomycetota bacterium]
MKRPWFRMHARVKDDAKLQLLPAGLFKTWVNLCCIACEREGHLPDVEAIAYSLHKSAENTLDAISKLSKPPFQLIDSDNLGNLQMHDWDDWQYLSDVSTERVRKHRAAKEGGVKRSGNVSETVCNARGETDQRQKQIQKESVSTKPVETDGRQAPGFDLEPPEAKPEKCLPKVRGRANPEWPDWKHAAWVKLLQSDPERLKCAGAKAIFERAVQEAGQADWLVEAHGLDLQKNGTAFRGSFRNWIEGAVTVMLAGLTPQQAASKSLTGSPAHPKVMM